MQAASLSEVKDIDVYNTVGAYRVCGEYFRQVELVDWGLRIKIKKTGGTLLAMISGLLSAPHGTSPLMLMPPPPAAFVSCTTLGGVSAPYGGLNQDVTVEEKVLTKAAKAISCGDPFLRNICSGNVYGNFKFKVNILYPEDNNVYLFVADRMKTAVGQRLFSLQVTGTATHEVKDLDLVAEVGTDRPLVLQFLIISVDGTITIEGIRNVYNPILSGFVIYEAGFEPMNVGTRLSFTANMLLGSKNSDQYDKPMNPPEEPKKAL